MSVFSKVAMTTLGLNLYAKVQAGAALNFTRMQIGGGQLPSGNDPAAQTALITPIAYFAINSISTHLNTASVKGIFENTLITVDTYSCELGLFATDPDLGEILYAYANALTQGDTIPSISSGPLSKQFQINAAIGNSTSVTATIPATTYIPITDKGIASGVATLDAGGQVPAGQLGNVPAVNAATTTVRGTVKTAAVPAAGDPVALSRVGNVIESLLATTGATNVLSYTPAVAGNFLIYVSARIITAATNITVELDWTDATGAQVFMMYPLASVPIGTHMLNFPQFINAVAGSAITVKVTAGTANQAYISSSIVGV